MKTGEIARQWSFQIMGTRMAFRRALQRALKKNNANITFEMLQVLASLWREQGISQQVLAERLVKDKACLTSLMNNLEKKGYVRREENQEDRRNKKVFLTPEGEAFQEKINPIIYEVYGYIEEEIGLETARRGINDLKQLYDILENY